MKKIFILIILFILGCSQIYSQWEYIGYGVKSGANNFIEVNDYIFATQYASGVIRTDKNNFLWNYVNHGQDVLYTVDLKNIGNLLFKAADYGGIYFSSDFGLNWEQKLNGFGVDKSVTSLFIMGTKLLASTYTVKDANTGYNFSSGVYKSTNYGENWEQILKCDKRGIRKIISNGMQIYGVTTYSNLEFYFSNDGGNNWEYIEPKGYENTPNFNYKVALLQNVLYATSDYGIYKSTDNGQSFIKLPCIGLPFIANKILPLDIISYELNLFITDYNGGVYLSRDNGINWRPINKGFAEGSYGTSLSIIGDYLYTGTSNGIYRAKISELINYANEVEEPVFDINKSDAYLYTEPPYPILASNKVNIKIYWNQIYDINKSKIKLFNIYGQEINIVDKKFTKTNNYSGIITIDISNLSNGVYLTSIQLNDENKSIPIIVNKNE